MVVTPDLQVEKSKPTYIRISTDKNMLKTANQKILFRGKTVNEKQHCPKQGDRD